MKIAKTAEEKKEWQENQKDKNAKAPFEDSTPKNKGKEWVTYKLTTVLEFQQKQRYEWFCAGFLLYYDDVTRNAVIDHIMTFVWSAQTVTIYLSPEPEYRKPGDGKYPNWKPGNPQDLVSGFGIFSDPPPPPPPPPPPMN